MGNAHLSVRSTDRGISQTWRRQSLKEFVWIFSASFCVRSAYFCGHCFAVARGANRDAHEPEQSSVRGCPELIYNLVLGARFESFWVSLRDKAYW